MLFVHLTELPRSTSTLVFESPVEIGEIVESALITDFGYILCGIHQKPCRKAQADVGNIVRKRPVRSYAEESTESNRAHPGNVCKVIQHERLRIMVIDILFYLLDTPAFLIARCIGKRAGSQHFNPIRHGQFI